MMHRTLAGMSAVALAIGCATPGAQRVDDNVSIRGDWAEATLARMTLREKAGQMVWPTVHASYRASDAGTWTLLRDQVQKEKVGGYTIALGSPFDFAALTNQMQQMSDVPLIFAADFEFGAGYRARGGYFMPNGIDMGGATLFPQQMALGATGDSALAYAMGRVTSVESRALGVQVNYSPILDVNSNPANPVINTRSYGEDPRLVARLGTAFIRGSQDYGMIATGKHFPGHGDTEVNSHLALPVVNASRARLDSVDLAPFVAAIRSGVGAIMTFHGAMLALDSSGTPGTLSPAVMTGLLRNQLQFKGLLFSDAMDMGGVLNKYGAEEATIRAVEAGSDILIQPLNVTQTIDAIVAGVQRGRYDEKRLDRSVLAILRAKASLGLNARRTVNLDSVRSIVGSAPHLAVAREIAEKSITLAKDSLNRVPLRLGDSARVLSVTIAQRFDVGAGTAFNEELRARYRRTRSVFVDADAPGIDAQFALLLLAADSMDAVVVSSYVSHAWNRASISAPAAVTGFIAALTAMGKPPIVVALGNPYLLQQVPNVGSYLIAWGGFAVSQRAAGRALVGSIPITGTLPINIPPLLRLGTGIKRDALR
jgi:beta-N-acetylhexosaminidase